MRLDASTAIYQLICQGDDRQYASMWDLKPCPQYILEQHGHSPVSENSPDLGIACLTDSNVRQDTRDIRTNRQGNLSKFNVDSAIVRRHV